MEVGQTLAIGGLIQNSITAQVSKVPILGDLPFIGFMFDSKTYTETEEEFIILVTPRLIDPPAPIPTTAAEAANANKTTEAKATTTAEPSGPGTK